MYGVNRPSSSSFENGIGEESIAEGAVGNRECRASSRYSSDLVGITTMTVSTKGTASCGTESEDESNEGSKDHPVGIAVLSISASRTVRIDLVLYNSPQNHIDDEDDESDESGQGTAEEHEDCSHAMVARAADSENDAEARKAGGDRMEDHSGRKAEVVGIVD